MVAYEVDVYQAQTRETAVYPGAGTGEALPLVYCALGAAGEAGEVNNKIKKLYRDGDTQDLRDAIGKEIGGVLWYLARLCEECDLPLSATLLEDSFPESTDPVDVPNVCAALMSRGLRLAYEVGDLTSFTEDAYNFGPNSAAWGGIIDDISRSIKSVYESLLYIASVLRLDVSEIADANMRILLDRKSRNVIHGSGDNR